MVENLFSITASVSANVARAEDLAAHVEAELGLRLELVLEILDRLAVGRALKLGGEDALFEILWSTKARASLTRGVNRRSILPRGTKQRNCQALARVQTCTGIALQSPTLVQDVLLRRHSERVVGQVLAQRRR